MCICVCRPGQIHWRDRAETIDAAAGMLLRRGISGREKERERGGRHSVTGFCRN